jgi:hypothetical protein
LTWSGQQLRQQLDVAHSEWEQPGQQLDVEGQHHVKEGQHEQQSDEELSEKSSWSELSELEAQIAEDPYRSELPTLRTASLLNHGLNQVQNLLNHFYMV